MKNFLKTSTTSRGFNLLEFKDENGKNCSIQQSSLATAEAIWIGVNENRMHLTKDMILEILPYLIKFSEDISCKDNKD